MAGEPVRLLHLGLGNFFRAHQCWYTDRAEDGPSWPVVAFTGRSGPTPVLRALAAQNGRYTVIERGPVRDQRRVVHSLRAAHPGTDNDSWLQHWRSPDLAAATMTITEAGYPRDADGRLDLRRPELVAELAALRHEPTARVAGAVPRLLAGLLARYRADVGPVALVPCDNLPGNGDLTGQLVAEGAAAIGSSFAQWAAQSVTIVSTMVDRITPRVSAEDIEELAGLPFADAAPVVTEPFSEWVLAGLFPAGRPRWETAGATFTDDVTPYENRKLWLLNGAHSLLAYSGSLLGHETVAAAAADERCRAWMEEWWADAGRQLPQPEAELAAYRSALSTRFANVRMHDALDRIAADGSVKLPVRIVTVLRAERAAGRLPVGATRVLAAWIAHLRGGGGLVTDVARESLLAAARGPLSTVVPALLDVLYDGLGSDTEVVDAVRGLYREFPADVRA